MAARTGYNKNNSGVKRIMAEARELDMDTSTEYRANPMEEDIFDWHCTIRGPAGTEFEGGLYHARIVLPSEYPFKAPSIMLLTPNGRFELNKKICISFTSYHEDLWQPSWGVRTAILGLQSFFPLKGEAALGVGGIEVPISERKRLAVLSRDWVCPHCNQSNVEALPDPPKTEDKSAESQEVAKVEAEVPVVATGDVTPETKTSEPPSELLIAETLPPALSEKTSEPLPAEAAPVTLTAVASQPSPIVAQVSSNPQTPTLVSSNNNISAASTSRPIDLTPSTPAARHIPARRRSSASTTRRPPQVAQTVTVRQQRTSPLVLDLLILGLFVVLLGLLARRYL